MKRAIALMCLLTGCAIEEPTAEVQSNLHCDPWCDPSDIYVETLEGAYGLGLSLFSDAIEIGHSCAELDPKKETWDCVVSFTTTANPCGPIVVECLGYAGSDPRCSWRAVDYCR